MPSKYRVYYSYSTNWGRDKSQIKLFDSLQKAKVYALSLVKELKKSAKETDDDDSVIIEDLQKGYFVETWNIDDGQVVHHGAPAGN